jgi:phage replication O-like protein O
MCASPQLEDGYTKIANEILDNLMKLHLSPNQWLVLLCVIRKTYGFNKKVDYIANKQIVESTGLCKAVISRALKDMEERNIILREIKNTGFNKDWSQWLAESSTPKKLAIPSTELAESSTKVSSCAVAQKKKETIQKKYTPTPLKNTELFDSFWKEYPRHVGKPVALKAFYKHNPTPELLGKMLLAIQEQKKSDQWMRDGGQFIPHPTTWLNQKRWEDEGVMLQEEPIKRNSPEDCMEGIWQG